MSEATQLIVAEPLPRAGGPGCGFLIFKVRSKHHLECFVAKQTPGPHPSPTESATLDVRPAGWGCRLGDRGLSAASGPGLVRGGWSGTASVGYSRPKVRHGQRSGVWGSRWLEIRQG